ncbi:MAG: hypothetical protein U0169_17590 [Polyangiaceae bacterium]
MRKTPFWSSALAFVVAVFPFLGEREARAEETPKRLSLGEVSAAVQSAVADLPDVLRAAARVELEALDKKGGFATRRKFIVSVAVVQLEREVTATGEAATCVVSAALRDAKKGALVAVVRAKARAEDVSQRLAATETSAVVGALRGAFVRLPEALR